MCGMLLCLGTLKGCSIPARVDGKETPDPYGRQFTGMEHWEA